MDKISIRFFDDKEVRAVWADEGSKWWFSSEVLTNCKGFKLMAPDDKKRMTDCLTTDGVIALAKEFPSKKDYLTAMEKSVTRSAQIKTLLYNALTDKISDREMFMKGIDYSYYYEQEDVMTEDDEK